MSADDNIPPFDLQIEIIKRLPIKSLIKFRSVSKPWKSIIHSSEFIADYNNHTHHYNPQQLLVSFHDQNYVYILDDDSFPQHSFRLTLPGSVKPCDYYRNNMIGYSQGLFGFYNYNYNVYPTEKRVGVAVIWNPSVRKSVDIPLPQPCYGSVFGFGVCNATDPMIVKIDLIDSDDVCDATSSITSQAEVFKLSTGVWRSLSNSKCLPRISLRLTRKVVAIDNFIYWLAFDGGLDERNLILSFDVTREEFKEIYLPPILAHTYCNELKLSKLRESLVVLQSIYWEEENKWMYDVWMREDGVQNSFKKLYTVKPPDTSTQWVRGFRNNGQPIIERRGYDGPRLFVYEPDLEYFNDIGIPGIRNSFSRFAGSYMGTLLLLDH